MVKLYLDLVLIMRWL